MQNTDYVEAQEGLPESEVMVLSWQFQVSDKQLGVHVCYTHQQKVSLMLPGPLQEGKPEACKMAEFT